MIVVPLPRKKENKMTIIAKDDQIQIQKLSLGPFGTNTYILQCPKTGSGAIVDAPGDSDRVLKAIKDIDVKVIMMTHNHMDHVGALEELKAALKIPVAAHALDARGLPLSPDKILEDGEIIPIGQLEVKVLHTPGHTPGSIGFLIGRYFLSGDTLFPGGPGKTRSPDVFRQIIETLTHKVFTLPDETEVYPGHGDATTLGKERPVFEAFIAKGYPSDLCGDVLWE
jgi:glyoxylase-like metal-dependent hydrolase (beta-lactamase superfamily II)